MRWLWLVLFFAVTFAAAVFGAMYEPATWYAFLAKPPFNPPNWVFAPVWTILYVFIAIAGWLAWESRDRGPLLSAWVAQMALNALWSFFFFGLRRPDLGLIDIGLLWLAIGAFVILAWPRRRAAAWLFVPYWAWVSFAAVLNFEIWRLNP